MTLSCGCSCSHDDPLDTLKDEHRVIERVLDATERVLKEPIIDREFLAKVVDFVRHFADGCHHAKEEDALFPVLERKGIPREDGPIGCMLDDHRMGRELIRLVSDNLDAAAAGDREAETTVRRSLERYIDLLRAHIWKEDQVLFAMAGRVLDSRAKAAMADAFDRTEHEPGRAGQHERYLKLADELYVRAMGYGTCVAGAR